MEVSPDPATLVCLRPVIEMGNRFRAAHAIAAASVAPAGFIDPERARDICAPNIVWQDEPLKAVLDAGIGLPVTIENDANAAGWVEYRIGTDAGGAIVMDGRPVRGGNGIGGELGHVRFMRNGLFCGCG